MANTKWGYRELDLLDFQSGIMFDPDLLAPVAIYPTVPVSEDPENPMIQTLKDFFYLQKEFPKQWMSYAGPAGIGQYSLTRRKPLGILARFDAHFRHPTEKEMQIDFENFGEQVIGPVVNDVPENERAKYAGNVTFKIFGDDVYFIGPPRFVKCVFLSRVFPGDLPTNVTDLVKEVYNAAETGDMVASQGYQFLHSVDGEIKYLAFARAEDFDVSKLRDYGFVEIEDGKMTYHPDADRSHPIDFTEVMHR